MQTLIKIGEKIFLDHLISNRFPLTGKNRARLGFLTLSGILFYGSVGFFAYAAYLWSSANFAPEIAALIMGGALLAGAFLSLAAIRLVDLYQARRLMQTKQDIQKIIEAALEELKDYSDKELAKPIQENPKSAVLTSAAAGALVGKVLRD